MKIKSDGATLNGFLDRGSHFHGELRFEETFRIDGKFEGKICSGSELILGETAEVGRITINGTFKGRIRARERIDLLPRARVFADLSSPIVKIEEGARFEGSCHMGGESVSNVVDLSQRK
jgi:cytoskeletal protein CcmA (bactofilin family)